MTPTSDYIRFEKSPRYHCVLAKARRARADALRTAGRDRPGQGLLGQSVRAVRLLPVPAGAALPDSRRAACGGRRGMWYP